MNPTLQSPIVAHTRCGEVRQKHIRNGGKNSAISKKATANARHQAVLTDAKTYDFSIQQLAEKHNYAAATIENILRQNGLSTLDIGPKGKRQRALILDIKAEELKPQEIAVKYDLSIDRIWALRSEHLPSRPRDLTLSEITIIRLAREADPLAPPQHIQDLLAKHNYRRGIRKIRNAIKTLGLSARRPWSDTENQILKDHYNTDGPTKLQKHLNLRGYTRTKGGIEKQAKALGLEYTPKRRPSKEKLNYTTTPLTHWNGAIQ